MFDILANTEKMKEKLRDLEHSEENYPLNFLVKTVQYDEITDFEKHRPFVTIFELSQDHLDLLLDILECSKGLLFTKLWEARGLELKRVKGRTLTIPEVLEEVWEPVVYQWQILCQKLKKGDMLFSEFERFFRNTDIENLRSELILIEKGARARWIDERIDQIQKYRNLKSCEFGAEAILEVVKAFELKGDFSQIEEIWKFVSLTD